MNAGQTYTSTCTLTGSINGKSGSETVTDAIKLVSNTTTRITVPAGAFSCYQVVDKKTISANGVSETSSFVKWLSPGNYPIEQSNTGSVGDTTTTVLTGGFIVKQTPTQLAFPTPISDGIAGVILSPAVTVEVQDSGGTLVADNTSRVVLSIFSGPAGATITGTTSLLAVGGKATFSDIILSKPGTYRLKATDGSLTYAISTAFTLIGDSTAGKLAFDVQPTTTFTGHVIAPAVTVEVEDADGLLVNTDHSVIKLAVFSGPSSFAGNVSVKAVDGVATFSNLSLPTPGQYTLVATDGTLTAAKSVTFTILAIAAKLAFAVSPVAVIAGKTIAPSVTVDVETAAGAIVTTDSSTVTLSVGSGPGPLGGTLTAKAVKGVATFSSLALTKAGIHTLKAVDGSLTFATSSAFTVSAAAAAKLAFAAAPAKTTAGKAIAPVNVDIEDAFGNLVTTSTAKITAALASGVGTLKGTLAVTAKAGVATFSNLLLTKAGNYTLKVTGTSLTASTSGSFMVTAADAAMLVIAAAPKTGAVGVALTPALKVSVEDAFGNVVITDKSTVTVAKHAGPSGGILSGTDTAIAVMGVASFSNLKLGKAGVYTLEVTDGKLTDAVSASISVV
jgi:hypothetical protein